jgi:hypothetical protein
MFENMAMINEIASYRERDVNYSGVGLAGTIAPVSNAGAGAIGVDERHAIHEDTLGEDLDLAHLSHRVPPPIRR